MCRKHIVYPSGEFARWLDQKRLEHSMTKNELADAINVSSSTIKNYYQHKTRPREFIVRDLADLFGVPFTYVWEMVCRDWPES